MAVYGQDAPNMAFQEVLQNLCDIAILGKEPPARSQHNSRIQYAWETNIASYVSLKIKEPIREAHFIMPKTHFDRHTAIENENRHFMFDVEILKIIKKYIVISLSDGFWEV